MNKFLKYLPTEKSSVVGLLSLTIMLSLLLMIIVPVPTFVLDALLLANLAASAVVFMLAIQAKNVLEFSVLPTILIFTTLLRIVLNVSSSRLILGKATGGKVIDAIGKITVGGDYVVGIIIFIVITLVMFLVINKGTGRVAEVSARFVLDSLPGKQMSIDGDLNTGAIDVKTAQARRADLQKETDFYKSMDGATNFIKGDAIAGLVITLVNIIGGLIMGMVRHKMSIGDAAATYTILSVGDGLVNQVPSLLLASASALMVTKGSSEEGMNFDVMFQILRYKEPLRIVAIIFALVGILSILGFANGVPWVVCFAISIGCYYLSIMSTKTFEQKEDEPKVIEEVVEEKPETVLHVDKILMHVGTNVATAIVDATGNGKSTVANELKFRIEVLRDKIKNKYGLKIPNVRITDDDYIPSNSFLVRIGNMPTPTLNIRPNCIFASFFGETEIDFGEKAEIKELGLNGYWVAKNMESEVEAMGAITNSIFDIIVMYLEYVIENNLERIISREDIKEYKEEVQLYNGAIVEEINQKQIQNATIQKVVQSLLAEKISIKNFEYILESIADYYTERNGQMNNHVDLMYFIRKRILNVITEDMVQNGVLNIVTIDIDSSQNLLRRLKGDTNEEVEIACANIYSQIAVTHKELTDMGQKFVFLCDKSIRQEIFNTILNFNMKINIISYDELPKTVRIENIKTI